MVCVWLTAVYVTDDIIWPVTINLLGYNYSILLKIAIHVCNLSQQWNLLVLDAKINTLAVMQYATYYWTSLSTVFNNSTDMKNPVYQLQVLLMK
jgi:hypothetical protein